jgi:hypothetical protein
MILRTRRATSRGAALLEYLLAFTLMVLLTVPVLRLLRNRAVEGFQQTNRVFQP